MATRWLNSPPALASHPEGAARAAQLLDRLLETAAAAAGTAEFLRQTLPELAAELSAQWAALIQRTPEWTTLVQHGRVPWPDPPYRFLEETLDRGTPGMSDSDEHPGWRIIAVPLRSRMLPSGVLVAAGRALPEDGLPFAVTAARALGSFCDVLSGRDRSERRVQRLRAVLQIASALSTARETEPLLHRIAEEATRLLECDRASIFIWDREHHEVVACPALGVSGGLPRLPDRAGVVGEVIHGGRTIHVDDAYRDPRFNQKVDAASGYRTANLLCAPLIDAEGQLIGAFEVINKHHGSFSDEDETTLAELGTQAAIALQNTREREQLLRTHRQLTEQVTRGAQIIGDSPAIAALRSTIHRLAVTDLPVLVLGESGTGKEVVSQALHYQGPRAERPFIAVNCAALTETLLESELFGHEKGAFTDAHETRRGKFELADGGTLFLDEIGDMSLGGQAKLLRVLEQKVITRVGGSQAIPINVRIIAATNANLAEAVRAKKFREDLYYRLSVVTLELPPLRERPDDILPLAEHFLRQFAVQARRPRLALSPEARRRLQAHAWPGNIRELRNLMERVAFLAPGERVEAEDLAFILSPDRDTLTDPSPDMGLTEATSLFQQEYIRRAIKRVRGNMSEAARLLGLHRSNLYRKMRQLDMSEGADEPAGD